jgi:hypothetical protein
MAVFRTGIIIPIEKKLQTCRKGKDIPTSLVLHQKIIHPIPPCSQNRLKDRKELIKEEELNLQGKNPNSKKMMLMMIEKELQVPSASNFPS